MINDGVNQSLITHNLPAASHLRVLSTCFGCRLVNVWLALSQRSPKTEWVNFVQILSVTEKWLHFLTASGRFCWDWGDGRKKNTLERMNSRRRDAIVKSHPSHLTVLKRRSSFRAEQMLRECRVEAWERAKSPHITEARVCSPRWY